MNEKIYNLAKSCLGKDIAKTQNELGCAEAVSYLLTTLNVAGFPKAGYLSTLDLFHWLKAHATQVTVPEIGDVIISPTGTSSKKSAHGHVGIVAKFGVLSNNSMNGLFEEYYTLEKWRAYYGDKLGFPIYYFKIN